MAQVIKKTTPNKRRSMLIGGNQRRQSYIRPCLFHVGYFMSLRRLPARREATWPDETARFLSRRKLSERNSYRKQVHKTPVCVCVSVSVYRQPPQSVPPRKQSSWEQYHLSPRAIRQWGPDGELRFVDPMSEVAT